MKGKFILLIAYISLAPILLLVFIFLSLLHLHQNSNPANKNIDILKNNVRYRALPEERLETNVNIEIRDARVEVLKDFFSKHKSPLLPYADNIVQVADNYKLDYKLLPAIAMQESNLCKKIPKDSFNCWGFGIYGGKVTRFSDYSEAIETVTKTLAREYKNKGLDDPYEIMKKYTPSSNGSWAYSVTYFMNSIKYNL